MNIDDEYFVLDRDPLDDSYEAVIIDVLLAVTGIIGMLENVLWGERPALWGIERVLEDVQLAYDVLLEAERRR